MSDVHVCEVVDNKLLNETSFAINIYCGELAKKAQPGQFLHIQCGEGLILRRPIGISGVNGDVLEFVFEVKGKGTGWLSRQEMGTFLNIMGPLGNGYHIPDRNIIVVGGGLGSPPMLFAAETAKKGVTAVLGFRDASRVMLVKEFTSVCDRVILTTDDGSMGTKGQVTGPLEELLEEGGYDTVITCGQFAMMHSVAKLCEKYGVSCQVSLEERMGCGVGACLVCTCAVYRDGGEYMSRVCKDGPVFNAKDVVWQ